MENTRASSDQALGLVRVLLALGVGRGDVSHSSALCVSAGLASGRHVEVLVVSWGVDVFAHRVSPRCGDRAAAVIRRVQTVQVRSELAGREVVPLLG